MNEKEFRAWASEIDALTQEQKVEVAGILVAENAEAVSIATIELRVGKDRICPHCETSGAISKGTARGLRRYLCKDCGKTFNALSGTPLSRLRHKERWLDFGQSLADGDTVAASSEACKVAVSTAFRWRHRFLQAVENDVLKLRGIVEADETFILSSRKGERNLDRKPRKRGGRAGKRGLSDEQVPILVAADRSGATVSAVLPSVCSDSIRKILQPIMDKDALLVTDGCTSYPPCAKAMGISHEAVNLSSGIRIRGALHIQTVNSRHERLKTFLRRHRGIATKYLDNYLKWFHLSGLHNHPTSRACLNAAMG